jgi:hypothetical protein
VSLQGTTDDSEREKMRSQLGSSIVSEKPNVKWDDVSGLEHAKDALKEAVILPVKFPQVCPTLAHTARSPLPVPSTLSVADAAAPQEARVPFVLDWLPDGLVPCPNQCIDIECGATVLHV